MQKGANLPLSDAGGEQAAILQTNSHGCVMAHPTTQHTSHSRPDTYTMTMILACRIASSYATARHYAHQNHLVALAMFEWHNFARQQKAMRKHLRQAVQHYDGRKLQGQTFQIWKRWCNIEGRANVCPAQQSSYVTLCAKTCCIDCVMYSRIMHLSCSTAVVITCCTSVSTEGCC